MAKVIVAILLLMSSQILAVWDACRGACFVPLPIAVHACCCSDEAAGETGNAGEDCTSTCACCISAPTPAEDRTPKNDTTTPSSYRVAIEAILLAPVAISEVLWQPLASVTQRPTTDRAIARSTPSRAVLCVRTT